MAERILKMGVFPVTGNRYWYVSVLTPEIRDKLVPGPTYLPGVKVLKDRTIYSPDNAVDAVGRMLDELGAQYHATANGAAWNVHQDFMDLVSPEIRDWVPDFMVDFQKRAVLYACNRPGSLFCIPCGKGKTLISIVAGLADPGRILVVTKANAKRPVYRRQIERYSTVTPKILDGISSGEISKDERVVVVGWQQIRPRLEDLLIWKPTTVILDESHMGKNYKRIQRIPLPTGKYDYRSKGMAGAAMDLCRAANRRIELTATPIANLRIDLYAQLDNIEPYGFGTYKAFGERYCDLRAGEFSKFDIKGKSCTPELLLRMNRCIFFVSHAEASKDMKFAKHRIPLYLTGAEQNKPGAFRKEFKEAKTVGQNVEAKLMQAASRKRQYVKDLTADLLADNRKIVLFTGRQKEAESWFHGLNKMIQTKVNKGFFAPRTKAWWFHGGVSLKDRERIVDEYMTADDCSLLVSTGDAAGESIELQRTDAALFAMLPYTPRQIEQWEGRFARYGGDRAITYYYLIAQGTYDEHVAEILLAKLNDVGEIFQRNEAGQIATAVEGLDDEGILLGKLAEGL